MDEDGPGSVSPVSPPGSLDLDILGRDEFVRFEDAESKAGGSRPPSPDTGILASLDNRQQRVELRRRRRLKRVGKMQRYTDAR